MNRKQRTTGLLVTGAIVVSGLSACGGSGPSNADQQACTTIYNIQALSDASGGLPVFAQNAVYVAIGVKLQDASKPLQDDMIAANRKFVLLGGNVPKTADLLPMERDCAKLGIHPPKKMIS